MLKALSCKMAGIFLPPVSKNMKEVNSHKNNFSIVEPKSDKAVRLWRGSSMMPLN